MNKDLINTMKKIVNDANTGAVYGSRRRAVDAVLNMKLQDKPKSNKTPRPKINIPGSVPDTDKAVSYDTWQKKQGTGNGRTLVHHPDHGVKRIKTSEVDTHIKSGWSLAEDYYNEIWSTDNIIEKYFDRYRKEIKDTEDKKAENKTDALYKQHTKKIQASLRKDAEEKKKDEEKSETENKSSQSNANKILDKIKKMRQQEFDTGYQEEGYEMPDYGSKAFAHDFETADASAATRRWKAGKKGKGPSHLAPQREDYAIGGDPKIAELLQRQKEKDEAAREVRRTAREGRRKTRKEKARISYKDVEGKDPHLRHKGVLNKKEYQSWQRHMSAPPKSLTPKERDTLRILNMKLKGAGLAHATSIGTSSGGVA